jgi:hypothetical protein
MTNAPFLSGLGGFETKKGVALPEGNETPLFQNRLLKLSIA